MSKKQPPYPWKVKTVALEVQLRVPYLRPENADDIVQDFIVDLKCQALFGSWADLQVDWFDPKAKESVRYGIQAKLKGYDARWRHCCNNGNVMLFATAEERDAELKSLRKQSREESLQLTLEKNGLTAIFYKTT